MKHPFALAYGLILLAAVAAGLVGPLYYESGESCRSLLLQDLANYCAPYEQRRKVVVALLLVVALPLVLAGLLRSSEAAHEPRRPQPLAAAAAGLLALPVALAILFPVALLNLLLHGFTQASTGLPFVFSPAALAVGALIAAGLAVRAGADTGVALAAAAAGLSLLLAVQAVAEVFRWRLDDIATPLLLSGPFSSYDRNDAATLVTLALAAIPIPAALGLATWSRRQMPAGLGVGLLFLSAIVGSVLFEATESGTGYPAASIRWLPVVLLPAGLAVFAICTRSRAETPVPDEVRVSP